MQLTPVDHDPFAAPVASRPTLTPVDHDPFAASPSQQFDTAFSPSQDATQMQPALDAAAAKPPRAPVPTWGGVAQSAASNFLPSAGRFGSDIVSAVTDPVGTVKNLANVGMGGIEKLIPGQQAHEPYADAVGKFFADRYGGIDNIKRTIAQDPVGFAADIGSVLTGGELLGARAPGIAGEVVRAAGTAGRFVDPVNAAVNAAKLVGKGVGNVAATSAGLTTGVGATALKTAAKAGFEGGDAAAALRANMRGAVPMEQVIADAKTGLAKIKQERQAAYNAGMTDLSKDQSVLDFNKIDQALASAKPVKEFTGRTSGITVSLQPSVAKTGREISDVLDQWRSLPPGDFHTAEGFDALKQRLGDIQAAAEPGSPAQKVATQVYNIVKDQIVEQAPHYAKTMENYQKASDLIREIEGTLSLNRKARIDTQLRKLQSVMRNNVNTNYGKRADLVNLLQEKGAKNLMASLAGQSLSTIEPRGLARVMAAPIAAGGAGAALLNPAIAVPAIASAAMASPRLMGETAYLAGRGTKAFNKLPGTSALKAAYQARRDLETERTRP